MYHVIIFLHATQASIKENHVMPGHVPSIYYLCVTLWMCRLYCKQRNKPARNQTQTKQIKTDHILTSLLACILWPQEKYYIDLDFWMSFSCYGMPQPWLS